MLRKDAAAQAELDRACQALSLNLKLEELLLLREVVHQHVLGEAVGAGIEQAAAYRHKIPQLRGFFAIC